LRQALNMHGVAQHHQASRLQYQQLPELDYPFHDKAVTVTTCGHLWLQPTEDQSLLGLCRPAITLRSGGVVHFWSAMTSFAV
jgi:hypothetical protein